MKRFFLKDSREVRQSKKIKIKVKYRDRFKTRFKRESQIIRIMVNVQHTDNRNT